MGFRRKWNSALSENKALVLTRDQKQKINIHQKRDVTPSFFYSL